MKQLIVGALAVIMAGCASVEMSRRGSLKGVDVVGATTPADRVVLVNNSAVHLFWTWTIASGDLRWDAQKKDIKGGIAWFDDFCGNDDCYEVLQNIAERENCDLVDVIFTESSAPGFSVDSYEGLFGFIAGSYSVQGCAILRPREGGQAK